MIAVAMKEWRVAMLHIIMHVLCLVILVRVAMLLSGPTHKMVVMLYPKILDVMIAKPDNKARKFWNLIRIK